MAAAGQNLEQVFTAFSKFGDPKSDGKTITLSQSDKWMKQAQVIDGKRITTTDTGITFNKFKAKSISYSDYVKFIEDLASQKRMKPEEIMDKLLSCPQPGTSGATQPIKAGGVERLTDTSKYTGSHKERFDQSGKGRGLEGRVDKADTSGYVTGYKAKDTWDKTHPK